MSSSLTSRLRIFHALSPRAGFLRAGAFMLAAAGMAAATAADFSLEADSFRHGQTLPKAHVFSGFGCDGGNLSPALSWGPLPPGTRSVAITVFDPDAPTGSGWWHWIAYDIPDTTTQLAQDGGAAGGHNLPAGAKMARNDFGVMGYGGACPPPGARPHRYIFTVHALKVPRLQVPADASAALISYSINSNRIGSARLMALYGR